MSPLVILFAALFTGATSLSIGLLVLQKLNVRLQRQEALLTAYVAGSAGLSLIVFAMLALWIARPWCFAVVGILAIGACVWRRAWRIGHKTNLPSLPPVWKWLFRLLVLTYGAYTFIHALAPDFSPDGIAYHLGTVGRWFRAGGLQPYTTNMYANMPMGIEMLFLFAYSFGRHSAAALVHWQFYLVIPLLLLNVGKRFGQPVAGAVAGLLVFLSPVAAIDGSSSYIDMATAAVVVAMFSLLLSFEANTDRRLLIPIGALGGFAYACKMVAFPALPLALIWVAWALRGDLRRAPRRFWKPLATVVCTGALFIAPWLIKDAVMVGNPFSPFLNRLFPNPYIRISFEEAYRAEHQNYYGSVTSPAEIPLEVTVRGRILQGLLGPVFLLAPLSLFALRWPLGRRALLASLVFLAAYPSNIGTRFLLPALPFVSLAMGLVLAHWPGAAMAVVLFHAFLSWPTVVREYADGYAWRLERFYWKEALRIEPEENFLENAAPNIQFAKLVEQKVPSEGRVLTYGGVAEAYTSRDILVVYQAGLNNLLGEILTTGFSGDTQGSQRRIFRFPAARLRRIRLVQTSSMEWQWGVHELRILSGGNRELPRTQEWRLRAQPNPWEVQLAFDNCPITRWKTWQAARPGDFIEVDMGQPEEVASVVVELAPDQANARMQIEGEVEPGTWKKLTAESELTPSQPIVNSRLRAIDDLKRYGITHLAIANPDFIAGELYRNQKSWGITLIGEASGGRLYRLD